ncbi:MAG: radical SAM protein [Nanoarchaeota archaeon]
MKVVFVNLHGDTNMVAAYLHSLIEKAGYNITTIHFRRLLLEITPVSEEELQVLKREIDKINPDVVMMSVNSISFWTAVKVSKILKDRKIVWGGVQPLIAPEMCLKYVDIIVRGEGDGAAIDVLRAIENGKSLNKIKNVWVKKKNNIVKNDFRPLVEDLNLLPIPDFSDKNKLYIIGNRVYNKNPLPHLKYGYNICFSRGCPFSCRYCINHFYNKTFKHKYLRRRSVDSVIGELLHAKKIFPKMTNVAFWDDVFMTDLNWLREFADKYKKHINLPFFAYGNPKFVKEESMILLKKAGIDFFDMGVQSGSERIRKVFGRFDSNDDIIRADRILYKLNVVHGYDIIFSEFETSKDIEEGINFFLKLKKPFKVQRNRLVYYPGFEITNMALKEGRIKKEQIASMDKNLRGQVMNRGEAQKFPMMNYFYFIGNKLIPNFVVKYMLKNKWHQKHPVIMTEVGEMINKIENTKYSIKNMLKMIYLGEYSYAYNRIFRKEHYLGL